MQTNPFENNDAMFLALRNDEGQYSLWPQFADVPAGWEVRFGPDSRQACLTHIEEQWQDMRPASLVRAMAAH
ncbi:MbtH family protein [Dyella sp.]|uniref:MbtH family protein n=1 Tax=Dyella sp. TaxID=1869338 RepID=UPI002ED41836